MNRMTYLKTIVHYGAVEKIAPGVEAKNIAESHIKQFFDSKETIDVEMAVLGIGSKIFQDAKDELAIYLGKKLMQGFLIFYTKVCKALQVCFA